MKLNEKQLDTIMYALFNERENIKSIIDFLHITNVTLDEVDNEGERQHRIECRQQELKDILELEKIVCQEYMDIKGYK